MNFLESYFNQNENSKLIEQQMPCNNNQHLNNQTTKMACQGCCQKDGLINKYTKLIKLLKLKINKLEDFKKKTNAVIQNKQLTQHIHIQTRSNLQSNQNQQAKKRLLFGIKQKQVLKQNSQNRSQKINQVKQLSLHQLSKKVEKCAQFKSGLQEKENNNRNYDYKYEKAQQFQVNSEKNNKQKATKKIALEFFGSKSNKACSNSSNNVRIQSFRQIFTNSQITSNIQKQKNVQQDKKSKSLFYEERITRLSQNISDLKSLFMHVRQAIYHFIRAIGLQFFKTHQKKNGNSNAIQMLWVIMNIFEYSQLQRQQMLQNKNIKMRKKKLQTHQINKSIKNIFLTLKNI